jgi:hypothetical protein
MVQMVQIFFSFSPQQEQQQQQDQQQQQEQLIDSAVLSFYVQIVFV